MDTDGMERIVSFDPISLDAPSSYLVLVLIFLALAFVAGLLIILVSGKSNKISERPPVLGEKTEKETDKKEFCFAGMLDGNKDSVDKIVEAFANIWLEMRR